MKQVGTGSTTAAVALALLAGVAVFSIYRLLSLEPLDDLSASLGTGEAERAARPSSGAPVAARGELPSSDEPARAERDPLSSERPSGAEQESPPSEVVVDRSPHVNALRHPSDTFRNASLTTVIRQAGFVCGGVVSASPGVGDMDVWRVSCENAMVYLVVEDETGALVVDPLPVVERPAPVPVETAPEGSR